MNKFKDLVDINKLANLFDKLSTVMGVTISLLEYPSLTPLIETSWCKLCTNFYRKNPITSEKCLHSDKHIAEELKEMRDFKIAKCENGLVHGSTPIIIDGDYLALLHVGQIFLEPPDINLMLQQARTHNFDEKEYIEAMLKIPIIDEGRFRAMFISLGELASIIAEMGLLNKNLRKEIAKRKKIEAELKKSIKMLEEIDSNKNNFLSVLSHELRTPLTSIIGFADLLAKGNYGYLNDKQIDYLDRISKNGQHVNALMSEIMDLSRVNTGKIQFNPEYLNPDAIIKEVLDCLEQQIKSKYHKLSYSSNCPEMFTLLDKKRFKEILINLIGNAIKYTPDYGNIFVELRQLDDAKYIISVRDSGIGIPENEIDKIFNEFYQCSHTKDDKHGKGLGLGLSLTKKLIEMQGGKISVKSQPGKGTTFTVTMPVTKMEHKQECDLVEKAFCNVYL